MSQETMLFTIGEGGIDPEARIGNGEITRELLEEVTARLQTDEFYDDIDPDLISAGCVDGRGDEIGPNSAGGTFSLVMADALTDQTQRNPGEKAPAHLRTMFTLLQKLGFTVRGHGDMQAHDPNCGCGAEDKLDSNEADKPSILEYITRRGAEIRTFLGTLSVQVSDAQHTKTTRRAQELRDEGYATNGTELRAATIDVAGEAAAPKLPGMHVEGILVIDTRAGKALNRKRLHDAFGGQIDAFYLNVPALQLGTKQLATSEQEAADRFVSGLYYNVATAATLANNLRIVIK